MNTEMNKWQWFVGVLIMGLILTVSLSSMALASGPLSGLFGEHEDDDDDDGRVLALNDRSLVTPNTTYSEECGACHMAYPAKLLPMTSWTKIMNGLDNHFGENAELDDATRQTILSYLEQESNRKGRIGRILSKLPADPPLRITELPFHKRKHHEIPRKMVQDNPKVGSLSNCNACHDKAEQGIFDEDTVDIPGFGHWDD
ncbi:diheme cytochrome c [Gynuella sunshinyii]|uniref:Dihem cytochrome c n=1 Tax=Gynuella sunshinyii YC6258 TaxID=1445510 RepID=A0A0C5VHT5_9GAMM|nr:diheme cytochrome c [Gynuella sunshinyii]AJQ93806.1 hypothetical Protein YC6258_01762 [Gynuella sunshinyii YC6258]